MDAGVPNIRLRLPICGCSGGRDTCSQDQRVQGQGGMLPCIIRLRHTSAADVR